MIEHSNSNERKSTNEAVDTKYSIRGVLHPKDGGDIDGTRKEYNRRVGVLLYNNVCIVY